jgi:hypothetical protein
MGEISFGFSATIKEPLIPSRQRVGCYTNILENEPQAVPNLIAISLNDYIERS